MIKCRRCGSCCKPLITRLRVNDPDSLEFYSARGVKIKKGILVIKEDKPCPHLTGDNKCDLHGTGKKPKVCREFPKDGTDLIFIPKQCAWRKKYERKSSKHR